MSSARTTRCIDHLQFSEELCAAVELVTWNAMAISEQIDAELAEWHQLLDDLDALESRLKGLRCQLERAPITEAA